MEIVDLVAQTHATEVKRLIADAFAGFPWFESLDGEELDRRWEYYTTRPGFAGLLAKESTTGNPIGAIWWDLIDLARLSEERGQELVDYVQRELSKATMLVWERDLLVSQLNQGAGIGTTLRREFLRRVAVADPAALVLTRMRADNTSVIRMAARLGFRNTGVSVPSSIDPKIRHQYWYWAL